MIKKVGNLYVHKGIGSLWVCTNFLAGVSKNAAALFHKLSNKDISDMPLVFGWEHFQEVSKAKNKHSIVRRIFK